METKEICGVYESSNPVDNRQGCCGVCLYFNYTYRNCDRKVDVLCWSKDEKVPAVR